MDIEELENSTFEEVDNLGNRFVHTPYEVESIKPIKNGIALQFINGTTCKIWRVSLQTFLFNYEPLKIFCRIHDDTAVNIKEVDFINPADLMCKMKSGRGYTFSDSGLMRYRLMRKIIKWIVPVQKEFPFPD